MCKVIFSRAKHSLNKSLKKKKLQQLGHFYEQDHKR